MVLQLRFFIRVILPGILAFCLFTALILGYLIPGFEKAMMERKQETIRELTRSAVSILEHYHRLELAGSIGRTEAMSQARIAVKELRYGDEGKDYFWITDRQPLMVVHPYRPDLDGKDLSNFRDPDGIALFVEFVKVTKLSGDGFVDYRWQWKDDATRIVPKLSYVRLFEPWQWIIGTGIYIEDVRTEIRRMENRAIYISGVIGLLIIILLIIITRQSHGIEIRRRKAEQDLVDSRERYKALAEAASEGVLIWSAKGIHANKTLLAWLGYREDELAGKRLDELIPEAGLSRFTGPDNMFVELSSRMIFECNLAGKDGLIKPVHADFSRILINDEQAVMMVARPLQISHAAAEAPYSERLLNHSGTGFFRTTYDRKGRFISASSSIRKLLGLQAGHELPRESLESFFEDGKQYKIYLSLLEEDQKVTDYIVKIRRKDGRMVWVMLNAGLREDLPGEKWFEGTMDPLTFTDAGPLVPADDLTTLNIAVRASSGNVPGITDFEDLQAAWTGLPDNIMRRISLAASSAQLKEEYQAGTSVAGSLAEGGADPYIAVRFISRIADAICRRVVELVLAEMGPPPVDFAFIQLGSAGREEQTLATDQDNGLIFQDVPGDKLVEVQSYFLVFGTRVNEMLADIGYALCTGQVMAGNPRWCQPLTTWKDYFQKWTRNPGPDELLEISIFFDFAFVSGSRELVASLREFVQTELRASDIYFHHMAAAWKPFAPGRQLHGTTMFNLKKLLMPLTGIVRLYAMRHAVSGTTSVEKCISLYQGGVFSRDMLTSTILAWKLIMKLRLAGQRRAIQSGNLPDNLMDTALIGREARFLLENAIQDIENLMLMAANDFHTHEEG
jgi:PAS domain S-box-containing protein